MVNTPKSNFSIVDENEISEIVNEILNEPQRPPRAPRRRNSYELATTLGRNHMRSVVLFLFYFLRVNLTMLINTMSQNIL